MCYSDRVHVCVFAVNVISYICVIVCMCVHVCLQWIIMCYSVHVCVPAVDNYVL